METIIIIATLNFIPRSASLFNLWQANFVIKVNNFKGGWMLNLNALTEWNLLTTTAGVKKLRWDAAWAIVSTGDFKPSDELEMTEARRDYENGQRNNPNDTSLRMFNSRYIRNNPLVTAEQKREMGITVPATTTSPTTPSNARLDAEPQGMVKTFKHLQHLLSVSEPGRKSLGKDAGIAEISVFIVVTESSVKITPALSAFQYDGEVQRGLYSRSFSDDQEGMRAWYYVRKKSKGKKKTFGKPSAVFSGIIP